MGTIWCVTTDVLKYNNAYKNTFCVCVCVHSCVCVLFGRKQLDGRQERSKNKTYSTHTHTHTHTHTRDTHTHTHTHTRTHTHTHTHTHTQRRERKKSRHDKPEGPLYTTVPKHIFFFFLYNKINEKEQL